MDEKKLEVTEKQMKKYLRLMYIFGLLATGFFSFSLYVSHGLGPALIPWGLLFGVVALAVSYTISKAEVKKEKPE